MPESGTGHLNALSSVLYTFTPGTVIGKSTKVNYLAKVTNITEVLNDAIKWSNEFKKVNRPKE